MIGDEGLSVRKRVVRIVRELLERGAAGSLVGPALAALVQRLGDANEEDTTKELGTCAPAACCRACAAR
ncbi:MAG: hypothetical protein ACK4ZJ_16850 [Allorhizobium sp.]